MVLRNKYKTAYITNIKVSNQIFPVLAAIWLSSQLIGCGKSDSPTIPPEDTNIETISEQGGEISLDNYNITFPENTFAEPTTVEIQRLEDILDIPENATQLADQVQITAPNLQLPVELNYQGESGSFARYTLEGWDKVLTVNNTALTDNFSDWSFFEWIFGSNCECDELEDPEITTQLDFIEHYVDFRCNQWATYNTFLRQYFVEGEGLTNQFMNANQEFITTIVDGLYELNATVAGITDFDPSFLSMLGSTLDIYNDTTTIFEDIQTSLDNLPGHLDRLVLGLISPQGVMARQLANNSSGSITRLMEKIYEEDYEYDYGPTVLPNALEFLNAQIPLLEEIILDTQIINSRSGDENPYGHSNLTRNYGWDPNISDITLAENIRSWAQADLAYVNSAIQTIEDILNPPSQEIVFVSERDGNKEIYTMRLDGSNQTRLTNNGFSDESPIFAPDGRIIFSSNQEGLTQYHLYVMDSDGNNRERLLGMEGRHPTTSPSGTLAFSNNSDIYVWDGVEVTQLTQDSGSNSYPSFSPDGTRLAFISDRNGNPDVFTMDLDGSNQTPMTDNTFTDSFPTWYSNTEVAYSSYRGNYDIYKTDGTQEIPMLATLASEYLCDCSSGTLLYSKPTVDGEIDIFRINGNNEARLTNTTGRDVDASFKN